MTRKRPLDHLPQYFRRTALKLYKQEIRAYIDQCKARPCADCNHSFPLCVMQFDHRPGVRKSFNISEARSGSIPRRLVVQEVRKCDVVCANCHAIRTHVRQGYELL